MQLEIELFLCLAVSVLCFLLAWHLHKTIQGSRSILKDVQGGSGSKSFL